MKFTKLTIENYKSFQFATEIPFPVSGDGRSIFLIGGMNGAGKTSIMEAVNFALYGAKSDEIFRNINRREKSKGNANVVFELMIEMDDGSELIVKRSWSAGAIADPKPRDLTERLVVVRDGKRVSVQNRTYGRILSGQPSRRASPSSSFLTVKKSRKSPPMIIRKSVSNPLWKRPLEFRTSTGWPQTSPISSRKNGKILWKSLMKIWISSRVS